MLVIPLQEGEDLVEYLSGEMSQVFKYQWDFLCCNSRIPSIICVARYKIFAEVLEKSFT